MTLRQRQRRQSDPGYLKWLRTQRCACGCYQAPPCDAAHLRAMAPKYDKPMTGMAMKPDDKWALPLKHAHHMDQHNSPFDELTWWVRHGVRDPFLLCVDYYARYQREQKRNKPPLRKR